MNCLSSPCYANKELALRLSVTKIKTRFIRSAFYDKLGQKHTIYRIEKGLPKRTSWAAAYTIHHRFSRLFIALTQYTKVKLVLSLMFLEIRQASERSASTYRFKQSYQNTITYCTIHRFLICYLAAPISSIKQSPEFL